MDITKLIDTLNEYACLVQGREKRAEEILREYLEPAAVAEAPAEPVAVEPEPTHEPAE